MIDASIDPEYAAIVRERARREAAERPQSWRRAVPAGALAELPPMPPSLAVRGGTSAAGAPAPASEAQPAAEAHDPLVHLRAARVGFASAVILAFFLVWIWQRRRR